MSNPYLVALVSVLVGSLLVWLGGLFLRICRENKELDRQEKELAELTKIRSSINRNSSKEINQ